MTEREFLGALARRWWLVLLVPVVVLVATVAMTQMRPYQSSVQATVLIPGDTEEPGTSERPELMVLDDLAPLVDSNAFAQGVARYLPPGSDLTVLDIQESLSADRYSRVLTITSARDNPEEANEIAVAVAAGLPVLVNEYLIPEGGAQATVKLIDPPSAPTQSRPGDMLRTAALMLVGLAIGAGLAVAAASTDQVRNARRAASAANQPVPSN